jgi:voltage-gated potassium channel
MELRRRLGYAIVALLVLTATSCTGYMVLGGPQVTFLQALYMAVITLSTVGYAEVIDTSHDPALRVFNIFVILFGWAVSAYVLASITTFLVEGEITNIFWRRKMQKRISEVKNHYIVCGLGDTGRHAIEELQKTGTPFVAIEAHEETINRVRDHESELFRNMLYVVGDATDDLVLEQAGISRAKGLIAAVAADKDNLVITVMVRQNYPGIRIVARCTDLKYAEKLSKAGANSTVSPNAIGGLRMASEVLRPHVVSFLDTMLKEQSRTLRIEEIEVGGGSHWLGKSLGNLDLRHSFNLLPMAVKGAIAGTESKFMVNPPDSFALQRGTVLIVIGDINDIRRARHEAQHDAVASGAHARPSGGQPS